MESLQESIDDVRNVIANLNGQVNDHTSQFRVFQTKLTRVRNKEGTSNGSNSGSNSLGRQGGNQVVQHERMSKIEFPKFNGDDVKGRIFRCRHFFRINNVQEEMKVELATMHVNDRALVWHQQFVRRYGERCTWELYENEVLKRFGAVFEDHMVELKNLKQTGIVRSYQD
ncbi:gypsy/ty3 retroelement polyprotein [Tanacetum coccineum]|uniref:Gypsy/ty3 retroelement polyprotein n=1 Tax=Tanacetum coccineum TaxID=301880 RepID=A0ABQ5ALF8_9ASTR